MAASVDRLYEQFHAYHLRLLVAIVCAELALLAAIWWWPRLDRDRVDDTIYNTRAQEVIAIEEIQPTRQFQKPPPPPPPLIPVIVPDDIIIEDELDIDDVYLRLEQYADELFQESQEGLPGAGQSSPAPEVGPKPLRFVEPEYTRAARRRQVRAEVIVEVLVDEKGLVREATIVERFLYEGTDDEQKEVVPELRYGLEESALAAARRWMFQPARQNGQPVKSYTTLTFSFGV